MPKIKNPLIVISPKARASFVKVFKPESFKQKDGSMSDPRYSITLLVPKETDISALRTAEKLAIEKKWGSKPPRKLRKAIQDGDAVDSDGDSLFPYEGYEGMWVIKATTKEEYKPRVVGRDPNIDLDETEFYSGCWCRAGLQATPWEHLKKGVSFALLHVQKLADDEAFSGRMSAADMFDDDLSEKGEAAEMFGDDPFGD